METIQMLGSLGEFLGSIAVLATLIYLTIQVRHARSESAVSAMQQRTSHVLALTGGSTTSDSLAEALSLAYAHYGGTPMQSFTERLVTDAGMTERQALQVGTYFASFMNVFVVQHEVSDEAGRARNDLGNRASWTRITTRAFSYRCCGCLHLNGNSLAYLMDAPAFTQK